MKHPSPFFNFLLLNSANFRIHSCKAVSVSKICVSRENPLWFKISDIFYCLEDSSGSSGSIASTSKTWSLTWKSQFNIIIFSVLQPPGLMQQSTTVLSSQTRVLYMIGVEKMSCFWLESENVNRKPSLSPSTEGNEQSSLPSKMGLLRHKGVCALAQSSPGCSV